MPEQISVRFDTKYKASSNNGSLVISMQREIEVANVLDSNINFNVFDEFINNNPVGSGELIITMKNKLRDIDAFIDQNTGDLMVSAEDSKNYSFDNNGNLIYTYR